MNQNVRAPLAGALALVLSTVMITPFAASALIAVVAVSIILLSAGWPHLLDLPSPRGSSAIMALCGLSALAISAFSAAQIPFSTLMVTVVAVSVFMSFFHEMFRTNRHRLTISLSGTASGALLSVLMVSWLHAFTLASANGPSSLTLLICISLAASVSLLALALPSTGKRRIPIAIVGGTLCAGSLAAILGATMPLILLATGAGLVVGTAAVSVHFLGERVIGSYDTSPFLALATSSLPLIGFVATLIVRLAVTYMPGDLGLAIIPTTLGA